MKTMRALRRGQKLARRGKVEDALAAFDAAAGGSEAAADPRLLVHHALTLARAGRTDEALVKSARAVAAAPDDPVPAVFNAWLLLLAGRLDRARSELARAGRLSPANPIVPTLAGALDVLDGRLAEGCRKLLAGPVTDNLEVLGWALAAVERRVFELAGTDSGAIPPDPEKARPADEPPEPPPTGSARACANTGEKLLEKGMPRRAAAYLARAVELKPEGDVARGMLGAALFEAGEFARAEDELAQVPEDSSFAGIAQFYRAAAAYRLGRHEAALEHLGHMPIKGDAFHYQEWRDYVRGMTLVALNRLGEAAVYLARFIDVEPPLFPRRLKKAIEIGERAGACCTQSS